MIDRIELKNMHSKELRTLRRMIREELDFRDDIGSEIANKEAWLGADKWGERVRELREEEEARTRMHAYADEASAHSLISTTTTSVGGKHT